MAAPRLDPESRHEHGAPDGAWWGVHAARYAFSTKYLGPGRLLDVACGTGYGLRSLSSPSRTVVGADIDLDALRAARSIGPVLATDAAELPFPTSSFDIVTTFETIEHLERRTEFVAELARILLPGGTLVLSTPNAYYTKPVAGRPTNPFHVFEYTPDELSTELAKEFDTVEMLGQEISGRFKISPFWDDQVRLPRQLRTFARLAVWRVLNRLPAEPRDRLSNVLWGHPLYPSEHDYTFTPEAVPTARVLYVVARNRKSA